MPWPISTRRVVNLAMTTHGQDVARRLHRARTTCGARWRRGYRRSVSRRRIPAIAFSTTCRATSGASTITCHPVRRRETRSPYALRGSADGDPHGRERGRGAADANCVMSRKHKPRNEAKPRNAGLLTLIEKASRLKASHLKRLESVPRDPTEAYAWLKQLAGELLDLREKMIEEFRRSAETALHDAVPVWVEPWLVSPHLIKWVTDAVKAYAREGSAKGKSRRSMDAALGLKPSRGAPRDPQGAQAKIAIQIDDLKRERKSGNEIASALGIDNVRTIQRIFQSKPGRNS